jgi:biotin transport system substrate-specific component
MQSTLRGQFDHVNSASTLANSIPGKIMLAIAATGLMALAAHISLPLPFSPVPLTMAPFAVLLIGMTLGPVTAFSALMLYLVEGAMGMPVFTPQGPGGIAQLLGPTGGYLFSYPLAAAAAGWIAGSLRIVSSPLVRGLLAGTVATTIILCSGAAWLATVLHLHAGAAWQLAVAPFLLGESVKITVAAIFFSATRRWQQS